MGSYSHLLVDGYPILTQKNGYVDFVVNSIFTKDDFLTYTNINKDKNKIVWGDAYENDLDTSSNICFKSTAKICRERLELFGINYQASKNDFEQAITITFADTEYDFFNNEEITYDLYLKEISGIISSKFKTYGNNYSINFNNYLQEFELIFETQNILCALWSIFNVIDDESIIEYDLTEIINGGWVDENLVDNIDIQKIILLTEGKTDTEFIKIGINLFYPYLIDYFHFMDFENSRYEANASRLIHTVKSFVGSGIKNYIIALFDNDSAALKEINNLRMVKLPNNIKVLQYPNIELADNYPTIGPTGNQIMNINGLACSIEMYLGKDCLSPDGNLLPIQWTGLVETINKYQGVVQKKDDVQERFRNKIKNIKTFEYDDSFKELKMLIDLIVNVWQ
jgi:hypothetical protein